MAHTEQLHDEIVTAVAAQIEDLYASAGTDPDWKEPVRLMETFSIWQLNAKDIFRITLEAKARNTGRWHSQIHAGAKPKAFSRFRQIGDSEPKKWIVEELMEGPLALAIDDAISKIDASDALQNDPVVRLLEIPQYKMTTLWIVGNVDEHIVIAYMPMHYAPAMDRDTIYRLNSFVNILVAQERVY